MTSKRQDFYQAAEQWARENLYRVKENVGGKDGCTNKGLNFTLMLPNCKITMFTNRLEILNAIDLGAFPTLVEAFACAYLMALRGYKALDYPISIKELGELTECSLAIKGEEDLEAILDGLDWKPSEDAIAS